MAELMPPEISPLFDESPDTQTLCSNCSCSVQSDTNDDSLVSEIGRSSEQTKKSLQMPKRSRIDAKTFVYEIGRSAEQTKNILQMPKRSRVIAKKITGQMGLKSSLERNDSGISAKSNVELKDSRMNHKSRLKYTSSTSNVSLPGRSLEIPFVTDDSVKRPTKSMHQSKDDAQNHQGASSSKDDAQNHQDASLSKDDAQNLTATEYLYNVEADQLLSNYYEFIYEPESNKNGEQDSESTNMDERDSDQSSD